MSATYAITLPADHDYLASLPDGTPSGIRDELELRADGVAVLFMRTAKIASYAGESVTTPYRSTTGALTAGATVIYIVPPTTKYSADNGATWLTTDPAAGQSAIPLQKGINKIWCTDPLSPEVTLDYVQDTNKVINELRSADETFQVGFNSLSPTILWVGSIAVGSGTITMSDDAANYVRIEVDIIADGQTFTYSCAAPSGNSFPIGQPYLVSDTISRVFSSRIVFSEYTALLGPCRFSDNGGAYSQGNIGSYVCIRGYASPYS